MARQKIPGLALGVVRRGEMVVAKGYGYANVEHNVPVAAETIFQSGSVGKQFTAVAVMLQVEDGKLALDDSITTYLKDAPKSWQPITVRHLLTHTSGIPNYTTGTFNYRRDYTEKALVDEAFKLELEFEPGSRWNYSNTGYVLLGILVRKVSGKFYGDVLRERVFEPLGMKTSRIISESDIVPHRAAGYRIVNGKIANQQWVSPSLNTTADGALYLTVLDMIAWDKGLREKAILKSESWDAVFTPVKLTNGDTHQYGFGWGIDKVAGQTVHEHGGAWQGFQAQITRYIDADFTVIVFANLAGAELDPFVNEVVSVIGPH